MIRKRGEGGSSIHPERKKRLIQASSPSASPEEQCALLNSLHEKMTPKLTKFERGDPINKAVFVSIEKEVTGFGDFIRGLIRSYKTGKLNPKRVTVLVLTRQALRACELYKQVAALGLKAIKLFAKHKKVSEQTEELKLRGFDVAIGTPNRILKLADAGALDLSGTKCTVYDMSKDVKDYNLLTMPSLAQDTFKLLREHIRETSSKHVLW